MKVRAPFFQAGLCEICMSLSYSRTRVVRYVSIASASASGAEKEPWLAWPFQG